MTLRCTRRRHYGDTGIAEQTLPATEGYIVSLAAAPTRGVKFVHETTDPVSGSRNVKCTSRSPDPLTDTIPLRVVLRDEVERPRPTHDIGGYTNRCR